jgi:RNA polymerase subunit RPABC4/transcription elongation factor Spt4
LNAWTIGAENHIICITSSLVNTCSLEQIQCIIGHELGHIKAGHVLYHVAANYLISAAEYLGNMTFGVSGWISAGLQIPMLHWQRMSEFTADRAGLLVCQDFKIAQQVDMILAGFPAASITDAQRAEWVKQTKDFKDADYNFISKTLSLASGGGIATQVYSSHPFSVLRSSETIRWIESGGYSDVISRKTIIPDLLPKLSCLNCGGALFGDESFCPICGEKSSITCENHNGLKCVHCGNRIDDDAKYCNNCGEKIQG